jgi:hypothetical protein
MPYSVRLTPLLLTKILWIAYAVVRLWAAFRLYRSGVHTMLPSFFMWVLIGGIKEAVLIYIGWGSKSYPQMWAWSSALMIGLALALVIEAHASARGSQGNRAVLPSSHS